MSENIRPDNNRVSPRRRKATPGKSDPVTMSAADALGFFGHDSLAELYTAMEAAGYRPGQEADFYAAAEKGR